MKKLLAVVAMILFTISVKAQLVHPGDIVFVNQNDTASVKRSVMPAFVTKTHPNSNLIDIIYWEGGGNEWKYTDFPHLTITQVYENGYGYITKAEAIQYGIIDLHTYLQEVPDPLPIDFTKKYVDGKYEVNSMMDTVGVPEGKIMTLYASNQAMSELESEMFSGAWGDLTGVPSTFTPSSHTHAYSSLTGIPSTFQPSSHNHAPSDIVSAPWLTSFTEVDGSTTNEIELPTQSGNNGRFLTTNGSAPSWAVALTSEVDGSVTNEIEVASQTGNSGKYLTTNGTTTSWASFSSVKKTETFSGTTNASGVYTVTFGVAYSVAPNIQANITNQSNTNQFLRVTSVSTTGFTINVFQRNSINLLGTDVLLFSTANVSGATVDVFIIEK